MNFDLSPSALKKIEHAVFSTDTQKLVEEVQKAINEDDQKLKASITDSYSDIMDFCVSLNSIKSSLETLTELNTRSNDFLQETKDKISNHLDEYNNICVIEENLNKFISLLRNICSFKQEIKQISEIDDVFRIVIGLRKLVNILLEFKNYSFHHKLNSELALLKSYIIKNMKKEAEEWIDQNYSNLEAIGCGLQDKMDSEQSLLFDFRYSFFENTQMQTIYDVLYIYSVIKKSSDIINKMNAIRKIEFKRKINSSNTIVSVLYTTIGFFLLEFYLIEINISFDLEEWYDTIVQEIIQKVNEMESDVREKKDFLISLENALCVLDFDDKNIKDEILQLIILFFNEEKDSVKNYADIEPYVHKMKNITEDLHDKDIKTLFYKKIDDILLEFYCTDDEYVSILQKIQNEHNEFQFRALAKYSKQMNTESNEIQDSFLNKFEKILDEKDFDQFHQKLQQDIDELNAVKMDQEKKNLIIEEIQQKCIHKLERKEEMNPKNKINYNSKRALFSKMIKQLHSD